MTKRVVTTVPGPDGVDVRVYYDPEWAEYTCVPRVHCVPYRPATYHTDDRADAIDSARLMAQTFRPQS